MIADDNEDEYDSEEESDDISDEPVCPKDHLTELLRVDLGTNLRLAIKSSALSSSSKYTPEDLNELNKSLFQDLESKIDSVLDESQFTKWNNRGDAVDWKGTCQTKLTRDPTSSAVICVASFVIHVADRRNVCP